MGRTTALAAAVALLATACGTADVTDTEPPAATKVSTPSTSSAALVTTAAPLTTVKATPTTQPPQWAISGVAHGRWAEGGDLSATHEVAAWMTSVVIGGPGLVAAGAAGDLRSYDAAVWTSTDGGTWERVPDDPGVFGSEVTDVGGHRIITDLLSWEEGLVAVGVEGAIGSLDAAVWFSPDGIGWQRVTSDVLASTGDQTMWAVADLGGTAVAVGESEGVGAVWLSDDGVVWTRTLQGMDGPSALYDVTVGGPGVVAVGSTGAPAHPAIWLSADGASWSRLPENPAPGRSGVEAAGDETGRMTLVAASDQGLVAIGAMAEQDWLTFADTAVWVSADGFDWHALDAEFLDGSSTATPELGWVGWHGERLLAVGGNFDGWFTTMAMWQSADQGATWHLIGETEAGSWRDPPVALAPHTRHAVWVGSTLVLVGSDAVETEFEMDGWTQWSDTAAVWTATP